MRLPKFCARLVYVYGWFVLYHDGSVYWNEYLVGPRKADGVETAMVRGLYNLAPEMFVGDN